MGSHSVKAIKESLLTTQDDIIVRGTSVAERLNIAAQRLIGRITGGHIVGLTATQVRTLLGIEAGATADLTGLEIVALLEALAAGNRLDHGAGLTGLGDDDHTQYVKHSLATVVSDFLVASGAGAFVKKTLAETLVILAHTIASHSDTTGTGAELDELTDGSETTLHSHAAAGTADFQRFTSSNTWTKPAGVTHVYAEVIGAGGGGAGGEKTYGGQGGGGGGGGAKAFKIMAAATCGATETVTIGASGTGGASASDGVAGGSSSFGSLLTSYGGGSGHGGGAASVGVGGGGGGIASIGATAAVTGGLPLQSGQSANKDKISGEGAYGGSAAVGGLAEYGGGGGAGGTNAAGSTGGSSIYGAGGGGAGGGESRQTGGAGGNVNSYVVGGGGAGGAGASGAGDGGVGTAGGAGANEFCGKGGGGGGSAFDGTGGAGGAGGAPGGGGGGGGGGNTNGGAGGAGGAGEVRVWSW